MKKIGKKLLSIMLALCLSCSMMTVATTSVSAGIGTKIGTAIAKKALELGIRGACKVSTELAAQAEDDDALIVVGSIINLILLDGQGVTVNKISSMCEDILAELAELEENVKEYTVAISSAIDKQNTSAVKMQFSDKWSSDVSSVVKNNSVEDAFNLYIKYLIISSLYTNGTPGTDTYNSLKSFWKDHYHTDLKESDYTKDALNKTKNDLEEAFIKIYDSTNGINSKDDAYKNAHIFNTFSNAIKELVNNYMYDSAADGNKAYTVVECAATDAYYTLPFSSQQYEFVNTVARRQIMVVTLMQMALNEYLSMQGEYLKSQYGDEWASEIKLSYINEAGVSTTTTYNQCKANYQGIVENSLEQATYLLESNIDINTTAYTGKSEDLKVTLSDYMQSEDAVAVNLTINGYESQHDYMTDIKPTEADDSMTIKGATKNSNYITSKLTFYRVMSGGENQEVYYILDPNQFSNSDALDVYNFRERIKRYGPTGGSDSLYGDLYPVSVDYLNLIKPVSDGVNAFSVPNSTQITDDFADLVKVPYFSAVSGFSLQDYLKGYLPADAKENTYILTSSYNNNFNKGTNTEVKSATINLVNTGNVLDNTYTFDTESVGMEGLSDNAHKYSVILSNNNDTYYQNATMKVVDNVGSLQDAYIDYGNSDIQNGNTGAIKSGDEIGITFKLSNGLTFDSLVMVRHNAQDTETVLLDSDDFKECFEADSNGYYTFNTKMPYSNVEFILKTKSVEGLETDNNGNFIIKTYDDLLEMAYWVNTGKEKYTKGNYILANDIICPDNKHWTIPIGQTELYYNANPAANGNWGFAGTFDGNGHIIKNLSVAGSSSKDASFGLFGTLSGTVKHLGMENFTYTGAGKDSRVGAVAGQVLKGGNITDCYLVTGNINTQINTKNGVAGGIAGSNYAGTIKNCYVYDLKVVADRAGGIVGDNYGDSNGANGTDRPGSIINCYTSTSSICNRGKATNSIANVNAAMYASGEITYLLNNGVTDGTQVWYQNIDNGNNADKYPVFTGGTVYKVARDDKEYSNNLYGENDSILNASELRTYQRIILDNGTLSEKSHIAYGYGTVDYTNKVITVYMADTAERIGVLMHQGEDGKSGIMKLQGDYPKLDKTSAEILTSGEEEPDIYTDSNGCIFITLPENKVIPELTVSYTQKPVENYESTLYTLKVQVIDSALFTPVGGMLGGTLTDELDKDDPDYNVLHGNTSDDNKNEETSTVIPESTDDNSSTQDEVSSITPSENTSNSDNSTLPTGDTVNVIPLFIIMLSSLVFIFTLTYKRKKS